MINQNDRTEAIDEIAGDILDILDGYDVDIWGDALGTVIALILKAKTDAAEVAEEEAAKRRIYE